jgi:hypothetical protein
MINNLFFLFRISSRTESIDPEYIDETDSLYLGNLVVDLSDIAGGREREVLVGIVFGGTDIEVQAEIKSTSEKIQFNALIVFMALHVIQETNFA